MLELLRVGSCRSITKVRLSRVGAKMEKPLQDLYQQIFNGLVEFGEVETAQWFWAETVNKNPSFWRAKRHTILAQSTEITLIEAYRCLVKIGRAEVAEVVRKEVLDNPRYRQLNLFC